MSAPAPAVACSGRKVRDHGRRRAGAAPATLIRWLRFNAVGLIGIGVQLTALALLLHAARLPYLAATALAVEAAVLHNFVWHVRWTWAERNIHGLRQLLAAFVRFNLTNGAISVVGNVLLMRLLAGWLHVPPLLAGAASIACCSLLNFAAADRLAFVREQ